ncbi:putative pectinesterase 11 [Coffea eugenioides]|uniref:putative pectinesterase 11 n=1 Tax=Coffea eugenioides TaxID=49369 RepID=UPI000F6158A6|nr:putative pectinesterase 11 [Coffea eugenioides]
MNVDQSGKGDHRRIQDAIDAEPFNNSHHVYILVNAGTYKEKIAVPPNKAFLTLSGIKPATSKGTLKCHLHSVSQGNGAITSQRRQSPSQETGFIFVGCKVSGAKSALLGRPWGAYSRVVFALCYMSNVIMPQGWDDWGSSSKQKKSILESFQYLMH